MGLAISKYIVEGMGGEISVESDGINGSTFTFYIYLDDETDIKQLLDLHGKELQDKNVTLAAQLGAAMERNRALENQIKLLNSARQPWWKRLFTKNE